MSKMQRGRDINEKRVEGRLYISGLKGVTRMEIKDWLSKYGKVIDVVIFDRYILVQFDREGDASRAIGREKSETYRGLKFEIRYAYASDGSMSGRHDVPRSRSPRTQSYDRDSRDMSPSYRDSGRDRSLDKDRHFKDRRGISPDTENYDRPRNTRSSDNKNIKAIDSNSSQLAKKVSPERPSFDAAIIVMSSDLLNYAETIDSKFQRQIPLKTHIIVLKEESHVTACIEDLEKKGVLYALLVNHMNEKHLSCTLRILHGVGQEHRNMLLSNTLTFIARNFEEYKNSNKELVAKSSKSNYDPSRMPPGFVAPDDKVIYQLHLLADSRMLTIEELNDVDEFIQKRIQVLAQAEGALPKTNGLLSHVREDQSHLNKASHLPNNTSQKESHGLINSNMDQFGYDNDGGDLHGTNNSLPNSKVQQALDSLMQSQFRSDQVDDGSQSFVLGQSGNNPYIAQNMGMGMNVGMNMNPGMGGMNVGMGGMNAGMGGMNAGMGGMNAGMGGMNVGMGGMNPGMMGMGSNMNMPPNMNMNPMGMVRAQSLMSISHPRGMQPGNQFANNYQGSFQQQQQMMSPNMYRGGRAPFQARPQQYPGY